MKCHVITPFSRPDNLLKLIEMLEFHSITWHVVLTRYPGWDVVEILSRYPWIRMYFASIDEDCYPCYRKINTALNQIPFQDHDYYGFMCDDCAYPPAFWRQLQLRVTGKDVIITSAERGTNPVEGYGCSPLIGSPDNVYPDRMDLGQLIIRGNVLRHYRFAEQPNGDGTLGERLRLDGRSFQFMPDLFYRFNYYELGRYEQQ